jgi:ubiquinone/menaquinone biosynthesis C-methylase UbiE
MQLTAREISRKYDRFARWYDIVEGVPDLLIVRKLRKRLLQEARGRVLEVAAGTGKNLPYYNTVLPKEMTAIDISKGMLDGARIRARALSLNFSFAVMDAEALSFPNETFDTVVSSLTMCTFPDPVSALRQMARVCKRGGRVLLLEHGRSDREWLGRWQDRRDERHARQLGCHWNRRPLAIVREAGLDVVFARRTFLGVFCEIVATV